MYTECKNVSESHGIVNNKKKLVIQLNTL